MQQFFFHELEPAIEKMQEKVLNECICTLTKGDHIDYNSDHSQMKDRDKGYVLSVVYPSGEAALKDDPVWEGWTVGKPSEKVALVGGQLAWL